MNCKIIAADDLKNMNTLIREFMIDRSTSEKTFAELLEIFNTACDRMTPTQDKSNDFRILCLADAMKKGNWIGDITISVDATLKVLDGIHRGIAYLRCVQAGIQEAHLPKLIIIQRG
jgi:hypothetical protein